MASVEFSIKDEDINKIKEAMYYQNYSFGKEYTEEKIINENKEPSTNDIDKNNKIVDKYIGYLTTLYNPVSITF